MRRLKPDQIQVGRSYRLSARYSPISFIRRVEEIRGDNVVVNVNDEMKEFPLKDFAALAVQEVER